MAVQMMRLYKTTPHFVWNDPERDKTMDDKRRFYAVRLGEGYVKHSQCLDGVAEDWELLEVSLTRNSLDAILYETEGPARAMATSVGGEVCCFGIYDAKSKIDIPLRALPITSSGHRFDWALQQMLSYRCLRRSGWNGKGMWIAVQKRDDNSKMTLPYIYMKTVTGDLIPWLASQADLLTADWEIASDAK